MAQSVVASRGRECGGVVNARTVFERIFATMPLVAILRGVQPDEVVSLADELMEAGFKLIEVPLNSPHAFDSIGRLVAHCPADVLVGAGTVLQPDDATRLGDQGARLMVTPNTDPAVIDAGRAAGLVPMVGCMTPSEALRALSHGAAALKVFPANCLAPHFARDLKAVLPDKVPIVAVGGIGKAEMAPYRAGGYDGFGFGGSLYAVGRKPSSVGSIARNLVKTWSDLVEG